MPRIDELRVSAYTVPTDLPESDGTYEWDHTTMVLVEARSGSVSAVGYSYADLATATLIDRALVPLVRGQDAMAVSAHWAKMGAAVRNVGRPGIASMAIATVDNALWDLKARLLGLPLVTLLGQVRESIPIYGSGGFTSYTTEQLYRQFSRWAAEGITRMKMKIGRHPDDDVARVSAAREAIGPGCELFVDANGAYSRKQALEKAEAFSSYGVTWFEEPVSSDDLEGLRLLRDRAPASMEIAAGEYGYTLDYFRRMLEAGAVDVVQADATRCQGVSGFMAADALCQSFMIPLSAHTSPSIHAHLCSAALAARHVEYFHDHARIENMLFDGVVTPAGGALKPDLTRPGLGIELKASDAAKFRTYPANG